MSKAEGEWTDLLHASAEGCMGATSMLEILRVLPQPIFVCDTASLESLTVGVKK